LSRQLALLSWVETQTTTVLHARRAGVTGEGRGTVVAVRLSALRLRQQAMCATPTRRRHVNGEMHMFMTIGLLPHVASAPDAPKWNEKCACRVRACQGCLTNTSSRA